MANTVPTASVLYSGDGVTTSFSVPFEYIYPEYVFVDVDGVSVPYTWTTADTIVLSEAPPAGDRNIRVYRSTLSTNMLAVFTEDTPFLVKYIDQDNKQLLNLIQEVNSASEDRDNVIAETVKENYARTLRVPDGIDVIPYTAAERANQTLGFDSEGNPRVFTPESGSAADVLTQLANPQGASMIGSRKGTVQDAIVYYTPEMFGAVGDGSTDDYQAIQDMLDQVPTGATIVMDGSKTYLNGFKTGTGSARSWVRSRAVTIHFNGAMLTRPTPTRTDSQTAVLRITGTGPFYMDRPRISGNNPVDYMWTSPTVQRGAGYTAANCQSIDYGIHAVSATQVYIQDAEIQQCAFNIWAKSVTDLRLTGYLHHSGQVIPNIVAGADLAYGAGIKLSDCQHFNIDVRGYRNTNATVEIEPSNFYGKVRQISTESVSNGLVIYDSSCIDFVSITDGTMSGCGTNITHGGVQTSMYGITGTVYSKDCRDSGLRVYMPANAVGSLSQVHIRAQVRSCTTNGADIRNYSTSYPMQGVTIEYDGQDNVSPTSGNDVWLYGNLENMLLTGSSRGCYNGVIVNGTNTQVTAPRIQMDLTKVSSVPYAVGASAYADVAGTRTTTEYKLVSTAPNVRVARSSLSGGTTPYTDLVLRAKYTYLPGLATAGSFSTQVWYDASDSNSLKFKP